MTDIRTFDGDEVDVDATFFAAIRLFENPGSLAPLDVAHLLSHLECLFNQDNHAQRLVDGHSFLANLRYQLGAKRAPWAEIVAFFHLYDIPNPFASDAHNPFPL